MVPRRATITAKVTHKAGEEDEFSFSLQRAGLLGRRAVATFKYTSWRSKTDHHQVAFKYEVLKVIEYRPTPGKAYYEPGVSVQVKAVQVGGGLDGGVCADWRDTRCFGLLEGGGVP